MKQNSGEIIDGKYRILKPLGQGGNGRVYEAQVLENGSSVAIKCLSFREAEHWKKIDLFKREAEVLSQLQHPCIPSYLDYFTTDSDSDRNFYLVQELVRGYSLQVKLDSGHCFSEEETHRMIEQVLDILIYLHNQNPAVIHRDIKPSNIILSEDEQLYLVDFGSIRNASGSLASNSTFVGTYGFIAPEQFLGQASTASDLYSLGATALTLLTHQSPTELPHEGFKVKFRHLISTSSSFKDWLDVTLEPTPEQRFDSTEQALQALQNPEITKKYRSPALTRPNGSKVTLEVKQDSFFVEIPPKRPSIGDLVAVLPAAAIFAFAGMIFFSNFGIQGNPYTFDAIVVRTFCALPVALPGILVLWRTLFGVFGSTSLEVCSDDFKLKWSLFFFSHSASGQTANIGDVRLSCATNEIEGGVGLVTMPENRCMILDGVSKHYFGGFLSQQEREWLVSELTTHLNLKDNASKEKGKL